MQPQNTEKQSPNFISQLISAGLTTVLVFLISSLSAVSIFTLTNAYFYSPPRKVLGEKSTERCKSISDGLITDYNGEKISLGFDRWGYNYKDMIFQGKYCDAVFNKPFCEPFRNVNITIKWNEQFLSNKDCDGDKKLDIHAGSTNYINTGAQVENFMQGKSLVGEEKVSWTYYVKIIAAPENAELNGGIWYDSEGDVLGKEIWGQFIVLEEVASDFAPSGIPPVAPFIN